jgi:hypothetical protein
MSPPTRPQSRRGPVGTALRCYPRNWRARHGDEALEIARLLEQDGVPRSSIAWSYVKGAACHRIVGRGAKGLRASLAALALGGSVLFLSVEMLAAPANAGAAGHASRPTTTAPVLDRSGVAATRTMSPPSTTAERRATCTRPIVTSTVGVEIKRGNNGQAC